MRIFRLQGELEIGEEESEAVREIFLAYLDGRSARDIATRLNADVIRGPRGGHWNASTISAAASELAASCRTSSMSAASTTGRRLSKIPHRKARQLGKRAQWMIANAPHLRIVEQDVWDMVQR